jgi:hypothetical protein
MSLLHPKIAITFLMWLSISILFIASPVFSLNKNDWAVYNVKAYWFSNIPEETPPLDVLYINDTIWRLQVEDVVDKRIRISIEKSLNNGTSVDFREGDFWSGEGNLSLWIVRENLNVGYSVYLNSELKVNKTGFYDFAGVSRDCAYGWFTQQMGQVREEHAFFWDRATGILCGSVASYVYVRDSNTTRLTIYTSIIETNLWSSESDGSAVFNNWWFGVAVSVVILIVACVLFLRERRKVGRRRFVGRRYASNRRLFRKTLIKVPLIYNC